jgi:hypothetical protein
MPATPPAPQTRGDQPATPPSTVPAPRSPEAGAQTPAPTAPDRLVPIGRLVTSGPDTTERHYTDADLGNSWFSTKQPVRTDQAPPVPPQRTGGDAPAAAPEATAGRRADTDGVVIDLDITGLFHGYGVTAEQALIVARDEQAGTKPAETAGPAEATPPAEADGPAEAAGTEPEGEKKNAEAEEPAPERAPETAPQPTATALSAADLDALRWRLDGGTLREVVDDREALRELGARLDGPLAEEQDNVARTGLLCVRAEVYRLLGELGMAAAASRLALAHAEAAGDVQATVIAQAELAHVLRLRGDFGEADRLFEQAASSEAPEVLRSVVHENAGRCCFDQGRLMEALDHFARAIRLGAPDDLDLVERIGVSLEAVYIHVLRDGWGPYPRLRSEILS